MPLDQVKAVLRAPDVETRTKEIIAHLTAMETKLAEMQMSVASLRALLEGPPYAQRQSSGPYQRPRRWLSGAR